LFCPSDCRGDLAVDCSVRVTVLVTWR